MDVHFADRLRDGDDERLRIARLCIEACNEALRSSGCALSFVELEHVAVDDDVTPPLRGSVTFGSQADVTATIDACDEARPRQRRGKNVGDHAAAPQATRSHPNRLYLV